MAFEKDASLLKVDVKESFCNLKHALNYVNRGGNLGPDDCFFDQDGDLDGDQGHPDRS